MEETVLYNGEISLEFDPLSHVYTLDDRVIPGVTSILGVINKEPLKNWKMNEALAYIESYLEPGVPLDEVELNHLIQEARNAHLTTSTEATVKGSEVHGWIERYTRHLLGEGEEPEPPINQDVLVGCEAWLRWVEKSKIKFLDSERPVFSKKYEYTGTTDAIAILNRSLICLDYKRSKRIYPDYFIQVSAYAKAFEEETGEKIDKGVVLKIPRGNRKKPYCLERETTMIDENFRVFLAALHIYKWQNK